MRPGDAWYLIFSAAHASPRAREMVWSFIREKWALFTECYKGMFLITRIVDVSFAIDFARTIVTMILGGVTYSWILDSSNVKNTCFRCICQARVNGQLE